LPLARLRRHFSHSQAVRHMPTPNTENLYLPILRLLADDLDHPSQEIRERLKVQFNIAPHEDSRKLENGKTVFNDAFDRALANLQAAPHRRLMLGNLKGVPHGHVKAINKDKVREVYRITKIGKTVLERNPSHLPINALEGGRVVDASSGQNSRFSKTGPPRVLLARVGEMIYYAGPQIGDERPTGGGGYTKGKLGHEVFNFTKNFDGFEGRLYGFIQPGGKNHGQITLERIDPVAGLRTDKLENVLVIFIARQRIIGWYLGASVHRTRVAFPAEVAKQIGQRLSRAGIKDDSFVDFSAEASADDSRLLPTEERTFEVPGNVKGGFGQSNVCYVFDERNSRKKATWMDDAISYVLNYDKGNLLRNPYAEVSSKHATAIAQEQAAGFQSNPAIRRAIEEYAMERARNALNDLDYGNLNRTSAYKEYDYTCDKGGKAYFVEVKGTQTKGKTVILTKNEVEHARSNSTTSIIIIVHSVKVSVKKKNIQVSGGTTVVKEQWQLYPEHLSPIQYAWTVT
jgi:hypothetical protein